MQRKTKSHAAKSCRKVQSGLYLTRGKNHKLSFLNDGYRPAKIGGEYVKLYDPQSEKRNGIEAYDPQIELRLDLVNAFSQFKGVEYRVLYRMLVQGLSIDRATQRMKRSREYWRTWYVQTALPKLRKALAAYYQNGRVTI